MPLFVICGACNTEHYVDEVDSLDIEEGLMGEDVLTFQCNETNSIQKSVVYGKPGE
jgi:hypothetical protein